MADQAVLTMEQVEPWLSTLFPEAQATLSVSPLTADASTRRYFRVQWRPSGTGRAISRVIMVCDPWLETETPDFITVARHLAASGVRVPAIEGMIPASGWMCLEDFGDRALADAWRDAAKPERLVWGQRALDAVVRMHTTATQHYDAACPAFHLAFDVPKLLSELQHFRLHAIEGLWQQQELTDDERDVFDAACHPLCAHLEAQPQYFCHRDYHGWNIMAQDKTVGILDFQDARMGPQPYDVVSLLVDRRTPSLLGRDVSTALVQYYLDRFEAESGQRVDRAAFDELFELVAVQRCIKAIGTFAAMHMIYGRSQYLPYIEPTLTYLRPLVQRHAMLASLEAVLYRYTPLAG
ncbi:aminoglycoside phosphotransferase family protein [Candidatus Entotheonella palauensis]|uniref:aminoglycoside phosphotransferase family protein n=1 Tax=Candidatus Entotheonella palauensis TaxID=93172 RepID=UPI000B7F659E|nr:phosphotransferase [Candidatus Entotheonella palauensis]